MNGGRFGVVSCGKRTKQAGMKFRKTHISKYKVTGMFWFAFAVITLVCVYVIGDVTAGCSQSIGTIMSHQIFIDTRVPKDARLTGEAVPKPGSGKSLRALIIKLAELSNELRALRAYLRTRKDNLTWLFLSSQGTQMVRQNFNYLVAEMGKRAGLGHVHPTCIRHSCDQFRRAICPACRGMQIPQQAMLS